MEPKYLVFSVPVSIFFFLELKHVICCIRDRKKCTTEISGKCEANGVGGAGGTHTMIRFIRFSYVYQGKSYMQWALDGNLVKKGGKRFEKGLSYPLWIDPDEPKHFCCDEKRYYAKEIISVLFIALMFMMFALAVVASIEGIFTIGF